VQAARGHQNKLGRDVDEVLNPAVKSLTSKFNERSAAQANPGNVVALMFYRGLKEAHVRFVVDRHPTSCPHCINGPQHLKEHSDLVEQLARTRDDISKLELKALNERLNFFARESGTSNSGR
jgi:hypothetical protein